MIVITLENCPVALRGDLTKWLQEISLGVYVGQVSARVRDKLWERVCEECKNGRATMVFSARNEQRYDFRVHNTTWEPIDYDGIKLMMRPSPSRVKSLGKKRGGFSDAAKRRMGRRKRRGVPFREPDEYVVIDIETTGLNPDVDEIIELGAVKVINGEERDFFNRLVKPSKPVPRDILELTNIDTNELESGFELGQAMDDLLSFIGYRPLIAHNAEFDLSFLQAACRKLGFYGIENQVVDTLALARRKMPNLSSYRLEKLAVRFGIMLEQPHRALFDAQITHRLFLKLIEK